MIDLYYDRLGIRMESHGKCVLIRFDTRFDNRCTGGRIAYWITDWTGSYSELRREVKSWKYRIRKEDINYCSLTVLEEWATGGSLNYLRRSFNMEMSKVIPLSRHITMEELRRLSY